MTGAPQFFVVGTPRSGTTLARAILTGHSQIEIPGETGFLPRLLQLRPLWWGRRGLRPRVFARLICANGRLSRSGMSRGDVLAAVSAEVPATPTAAISAVFDEFGRRTGKMRVGDKTPFYIDHLARLGAAYPEARFVQMVRHPLDTVSSLLVQPWGPNDPLAAALQWSRSQDAAARADLGDRLLVLRLEDVVARPEVSVDVLSRHLGVEPEPAMLEFVSRADAIAQQNVHPVSHQGLGRDLVRTRDWADHLSARQAADVWAIVGEQAAALGYDGPGQPPVRRPSVRAWRAQILFLIGRQRKRLGTLRRVVSR